jgi:hypothetical protein
MLSATARFCAASSSSAGRHPFARLLACVLLTGLGTSAEAQLVQRSGGVYDTDRDITWLADANFAKSSGFSGSGAMPLFVAHQFVAKLNADTVNGANDWRLPTADPGCGVGFNCNSSEMGHLFYDELSGTPAVSILTSGDPDLALFTNIQVGAYWTSTPAPSKQWTFSFDEGGNSGWQGQGPVALNKWVWAVRSGDIAAIPVNYCASGTSASGCNATLSVSGTASATAPSGFDLTAAGVEGSKDGLFFFGSNGRQANPWGNGTSFQCVVPPVKRGGLLSAAGTAGLCDGSFAQDLNALWCPACPKPGHNPGAGVVVQAQLWYRDPLNSSNQTTSLSDAVEFLLAP